MDNKERLDVNKFLEKLSPKDRIYEELEASKIFDNVIGFIPMGDGTDTSILVTNLAVRLAKKGFNTCVLDAKVFYPSIYKLLDCEANPKGRGLIRVSRTDKVDYRDEINETKYKNLYLLSPSPLDLIEEYFDFQVEDVERVILTLKDMFDFVLIDIPNIPPLEFCVIPIKLCNIGFLLWSERIDCPQNTSKLIEFISSMGIGTAKLANVIIANELGIDYDKEIIAEMKMRLIAELPYIRGPVDYSLEGRVYSVDSVILDKRYDKSLSRIVELLTK
ncbi:MAG: ATPase [Clostridia bacterium]|nr:ATPase [Clostridia bacterium]